MPNRITDRKQELLQSAINNLGRLRTGLLLAAGANSVVYYLASGERNTTTHLYLTGFFLLFAIMFSRTGREQGSELLGCIILIMGQYLLNMAVVAHLTVAAQNSAAFSHTIAAEVLFLLATIPMAFCSWEHMSQERLTGCRARG